MLAGRTVATALQALLVAAGTSAGARWYLGRGWPVQTLPAGKVVIVDEDLEGEGDMTWPASRAHTLTVHLQCMAADTDDPEAAADALAEQALDAVEGTAAPIAKVVLRATGIGRQLATEGQAHIAITTVRLELLFSGTSDDPTHID